MLSTVLPHSVPAESAPASSMSDEQAVKAWVDQSNQTAARFLVERYRLPIVRQIRRWVNDHGSVEDIFQQTWIQLFAGMPRLTDWSNLAPWIRVIVRNNCIDAWTRLKRCPLRSALPIELSDFDSLYADSDDPQASLGPERRVIAAEILRALPKTERRLLWLYCMRNLSAETVGLRLGISPGNVRIRVHRLQCAIRKRLRGRACL